MFFIGVADILNEFSSVTVKRGGRGGGSDETPPSTTTPPTDT